MKRSGPPKRRKPLHADSDKTREFVARGRTSSRLRSERALREKVWGPSLLRQQAPAARDATPARKPPVKFRAKSPAREHACVRHARCGRRASGWHHWLPQQHIRTFVRGLRLSEDSARALLKKLLEDERNLVAMCHECHEAHEGRSRPLSGEEVPHAAKVFALELGPEWAERLAQMYPGGQR